VPQESWSESVIKPLNSYSIGNSIGFSVDMDDNYSAGVQVSNDSGFDFVNANNIAGAFNTIGSEIAELYAKAILGQNINPSASAYKTLLPLRYCNKFGNADLYDISLFETQSLSPAQVQAQPRLMDDLQNPLFESYNNELRKDCKEAISINLQQNAIAYRDSIIIGPAFWKTKTKPVKCFAYTRLLNKMDNYLPAVGTQVSFSFNSDGRILLSGVPADAKSIAFSNETADGDREIIFGMNERVTTIYLSFLRKVR
jgi:hypothetical protein